MPAFKKLAVTKRLLEIQVQNSFYQRASTEGTYSFFPDHSHSLKLLILVFVQVKKKKFSLKL